MKRFNTLSTKCVDNIRHGRQVSHIKHNISSVYHLIQRWNSNFSQFETHPQTHNIASNEIDNNISNSGTLSDCKPCNRNSNSICNDNKNIILDAKHEKCVKQNLKSNVRLSNYNLSKIVRNNHINKNYYFENRRLFNIQSQSASSIPEPNNDIGDNDGGSSMRDLSTIRKNLGKTLGSKIYIWGQVSNTSLGFEEHVDSALPLCLNDSHLMRDDLGFRDISVGVTQTAIVTGNGDLYMFGGSKYGELGLNEQISTKNTVSSMSGSGLTQVTPVKVEGISNVVKVSCGGRHTAAITESGDMYTWGWGGSKWSFGCGGLGQGNKDSLNCPKKVEFDDANVHVIDVSCGDKHTLALTSDGTAYAMGEGEHGRLGTGHTSNCKKPCKLEYFNEIELSHVYAAKEYSFCLTSKEGIPFGWGRNDRNQMGQGGGLAMDIYSCDPTPGAINLQNVINMDLSSSDVMAVANDGTIYYWGDRVYLEPNAVFEERFQDEMPDGDIIDVGVSQTGMFFISNKGELFSCNKTLGMRSDVFTLGHGGIQPFKIAKRVEALDGEFVKKISASDQRTAVIVE